MVVIHTTATDATATTTITTTDNDGDDDVVSGTQAFSFLMSVDGERFLSR